MKTKFATPKNNKWTIFFIQTLFSICLCLVLLGISLLNANAQTFGNVFIGGGGFVSGIIAAPNDQNIFYARTDVGGAYRWNESAQAWVPLMDWVSDDERGLLGIDGIAVDPQVKGRVYILAGTSYWNNGKTMFLRSDDYGATWDKIDVTDQFKAHGNGMGRANGERLAVDPNNSNIIFCGTRYNGLWKSTDRGSTWTQVTALDVTTTPDESGVCVVMFDKTSVSNGVTQTIYAGVSREGDNMYVSTDAGATWSLIDGRPTTARIMPQRFALTSDGQYLYVTYGNGGGPHAMLWSGVTDYYNRGAVYKYDTQAGTWTDVSPEDFMQDTASIDGDAVHYGAFSGICIDPTNEDRLLATSINSWRGPQFWYIDGAWKDSWGDNIYVSEDGGATWREMFRYYWLDGGYYPDYNMVDANGIPWITGNTCHWIGSAVIDPYNPNRAFITSGNGVFATDSLFKYYTATEWENNTQVTKYHGKATWYFTAKGIEETVPLDLVSIPGGPVISVIGDYDGFIHDDITVPSPDGRLKTTVNGQECTLGTTYGIAYAAQQVNVLAKASGTSATVNSQSVTICAVTLSSDTGKTWTQIYADATPVSQSIAKGKLHQGKLAISADGAVVVWAPMSYQVSGTDTVDTYHKELFYYKNSSWTKCTGVEFSCQPAADPVNANVFYAYNNSDGYMYVSSDKGATFTQKGYAGLSDFKAARTALGQEDDIWVPLARTVDDVKTGGLVRSTDGGTTFSAISNVTYCEAVGFGKAATGASYPTVFIYGTVNSVTGVFMSIDQGASWTRINDDDHEYGGLANGAFILGDANTYGRVYMSTAGRGIAYIQADVETVAVTGVTVSPTSATLDLGGTQQLTATIAPTNATNQAVTWSSSNTTVATVSSSGLVTAVAAGTATITVTTADGGYTATSAVTVTNTTVSVTGVSVSPTTASIVAGGTTTLTATVTPTNATDKTVTWSSSNTAVATVSSAGVVTGVAEGSATITVTTTDGGYTATCVVTVSESSSDCTFGTPTSSALPTISKSYSYIYVLGTGGPSLGNVTNTVINWDLANNGLYQFSMSANDGNPSWYNDLRTGATWTFSSSGPAITLSGTGFSGLDGSYYVTVYNTSDFVMVSQTGSFAIYFSNSSTTPVCTKNASEKGLSSQVAENVTVYPNPFTETVHLSIPDYESVSKIYVVDQVGRIVLRYDQSSISSDMEIGGELNPGIYIVKVVAEQRTSTYKIIKK